MSRALLLLLPLAGCLSDDPGAVTDTDADDPYADVAMWACHPDSPDDVCARDLTATDLHPDGTTTLVTPERAVDPPFDCFYIYPTVLLTGGGLDTDFSEPGAKLDPLLSQAAPFTSLCRVFAPYYRQVSLDAFAVPGLFDTAYGDVVAAFRHFVAHETSGRPFAILGHSQGTMHLIRLLKEEIEADDALHDRLVVAVLLGGSVEVPEGDTVGGTFARTPICTTPGESGCVIAWNTYAADDAPGSDDLFGFASPGHTIACTDPQALAGTSGTLTASWFATKSYGAAFTNLYAPYDDVQTPFVRVASALDGACVSEGGATFLSISEHPAESDVRPKPPYRNTLQEAIGFGMHGLDYNVPIEDLLRAVGAITPPPAD